MLETTKLVEKKKSAERCQQSCWHTAAVAVPLQSVVLGLTLSIRVSTPTARIVSPLRDRHVSQRLVLIVGDTSSPTDSEQGSAARCVPNVRELCVSLNSSCWDIV